MNKVRSIIMMAICILACGCNENKVDEEDVFYITDIPPITLKIYVTNPDGDNLLNTNQKGAYRADDIVVYSGGEEWPAVDYTWGNGPMPSYNGFTRMIPAIWHGAVLVSGNGFNYLEIGEYWGHQEYNNEKVVVKFSDGTEDTITFSWHAEMQGNGLVETITKSFYLNGILQEGPEMTICKEIWH